MDPRLSFGAVLIIQGIFLVMVLGAVSASRQREWWLTFIFGAAAFGSFLVMWWLVAGSIHRLGQVWG